MTNIFTFTCFLCKSGTFKLNILKKLLKISFWLLVSNYYTKTPRTWCLPILMRKAQPSHCRLRGRVFVWLIKPESWSGPSVLLHWSNMVERSNFGEGKGEMKRKVRMMVWFGCVGADTSISWSLGCVKTLMPCVISKEGTVALGYTKRPKVSVQVLLDCGQKNCCPLSLLPITVSWFR